MSERRTQTPTGRDARRRVVRRRRIVGLCVLVGVPLAAGVAVARPDRDNAAPTAKAAPAAATKTRCIRSKVTRPAWLAERRATLIVDSVLLGGVPALRRNLAGWKVTQLGRPAVMVRLIEDEISAAGTPIAPLAIVGVGYNSLWERDRKNYANWAREFDKHATTLLRTLRRQGAKQIVWVTLRDARRAVIPSNSMWQYDKYSWYFPYVNERLRRLERRAPDLVLADWAKVSNRTGITYDAIHLDPDGQALMARTIRAAFEREAARQVGAARDRATAECPSGAG